jgi:hypothetical protein
MCEVVALKPGRTQTIALGTEREPIPDSGKWRRRNPFSGRLLPPLIGKTPNRGVCVAGGGLGSLAPV